MSTPYSVRKYTSGYPDHAITFRAAMANNRHPSAALISACSMMSTMANTECAMTKQKHTMETQSSAKRSAP